MGKEKGQQVKQWSGMRWILRKKKGGMVKEEGGINEKQEYGAQGENNPALSSSTLLVLVWFVY